MSLLPRAALAVLASACAVTTSWSQTPTPSGFAHALNLSSRVDVGTGSDVGIGGFIVTGTSPKQVLLRGIGPSLTGITNALVDPVLELHDGTGTLMTNDNWRDTQEAQIMATGIAPTNNLESAILVTLDPGFIPQSCVVTRTESESD